MATLNHNLKNITLLLFLWMCLQQALAQGWVSDSIQVDFMPKSIRIDPLSNRYFLTEEMQILKYKPDGTFWNRYENNRLGIIGNLDVSNPFQVLIFYPQYQILVLLDNNLAETGRLNFNSIGFGNIRTAGISDDNNIWVLDEGSRQVYKVSTSGEKKVEGIPYFGFNILADKPIFIQQKSNYVYISQEGQKVQVFDIFGKWVKSLDLENFKSVVYIGNNLYYDDGINVLEFPIDVIDIGVELRTIPIDETKSITYDVVRNKFYGLNKENQIIYFLKCVNILD